MYIADLQATADTCSLSCFCKTGHNMMTIEGSRIDFMFITSIYILLYLTNRWLAQTKLYASNWIELMSADLIGI